MARLIGVRFSSVALKKPTGLKRGEVVKMYRENIYEVMESAGEKINTLVVPKNTGLKGYAWKVLKEAGLDLDKASEIGKNKLKAGTLTLLLRRGEDIPQLVQDEFDIGNLVMGVTGDDLFDEYRLRNPQNNLKIENTYDWFDESAKFFRPALCLIGKSGQADNLKPNLRVVVNSKYEYTSRDYLQKSPLLKDKSPKVKVYSGDLEANVAEGRYDCCIDTVYTGDTIKEICAGGLKIIQKIRFSDIVVVSPLKSEESMFGRIINEEYRRIKGRKDTPTGSYTSELLQDKGKIAQKVCEEIGELVRNLHGEDTLGKGNFIPEMADSIYSLMLMLVSEGYTLNDIAEEMLRRQKQISVNYLNKCLK